MSPGPIYPDKIWEKKMELWYLAHPVSVDEQHSEQDNMDHVLEVQKILWEADVKTVNPWYSYVSAYGSAREDSERLEVFLTFDKAVIGILGGIILTGHKMSQGMEIEFKHALAHKLRIVNLIGVPDERIGQLMAMYLEFDE